MMVNAVRWLLPCAFVFLSQGCERSGEFVDADWHRKDLNANLARWVAISPTPSGLMQGNFDRSWKPAAGHGSDLTVHSRIVYSMIAGFEATGDKRYEQAARRGAEFLLQHYHDGEFGGFYKRVDADGKVLDSGKDVYGQAFAVLALSHMARVTKDERYQKAALTAWHDIRDHLRDPDGGFRNATVRDFSAASGGLNSQNHVMHIFEALLALIDATHDPVTIEDAREVGNFVLYKLMVGLPSGAAYIPEWFDEHWKPLANKEAGAYIDVGHQFEWIHLLRTAERRGLPPLYADVSERLLKYAVAIGYDETDGGVFNRVYPDGTVDRNKYWWPQAESMRAFLAVGDRPDMARRYRQTLDLVNSEILDQANGGWRLGAKGTCAAGNCGNEQPEPYHLVGLDVAALSVAASQ
jgi:mannose/cellobiose epimerase-like protein (N-acyl-D-glucosamine 2-epimerase family)